MPSTQNVLLITIDSLRKDVLGAYRDRPRFVDYEVSTPNLDRFAENSIVFDSHYAGSLPCMPQRREFLCGIKEFLWRPWGPTEPFDETIPARAGAEGIPSMLITDHYHYFEHGGRGYVEDFHGFEFIRGHETDKWQITPRNPDPEFLGRINRGDIDPTNPSSNDQSQYARNVAGFDELNEMDFFAPQVFNATASWLTEANDWDQWFCYVDSFDVHEPFHCPEPYASMYTDEDPTNPDLVIWPEYAPVADQQMTDRDLDFVRSQFAGKVTMVDRWFGRVLDRLDRTDAWEDTMIVVTTDHGLLLGEHGYIMKNYMPVYDAIANVPLLIYHPESNPSRVNTVTAAVDVYATILEGLGIEPSSQTHSRSLMPLIRGEKDTHRNVTLYGYFGADACITDGRYTYFHPGTDGQISIYSTMQRNPGSESIEVADLPYTDDPVWKYPAGTGRQQATEPTLYDTANDPEQHDNLIDERPEIADRLRSSLVARLEELDAPNQQFRRLNIQD